VAFPTETVYGLGANATDDRAVAAVFEAKDRPHFNPLIVHVADLEQASPLAVWSELAERLARHFWPGPLTLILPRRQDSSVSMLVSAGGDTIALRAPAHPIAEEFLRRTALPVTGPSANPSGRVSPTTVDHVVDGLGDKIDLAIDGGPCAVGVESTVLDLTTPRPCLLRPGGLPREDIEAVIGERLLIKSVHADGNQSPLRSPGQLRSHYAPRHPVRLDAVDVAPDEALLAFGPKPLEGAAYTANLSPTGDLREAASHLFAMLHDLDRRDISGIAVMPIPSTGLGHAIVDRLKRAAVRP
jgi:L-threonylcarbamoyladenylate synthase